MKLSSSRFCQQLLGGSYLFIFQKVNTQRRKLLDETQQEQQTLSDVQQATAGIENMSRKIADLQKAITFFQSRASPPSARWTGFSRKSGKWPAPTT